RFLAQKPTRSELHQKALLEVRPHAIEGYDREAVKGRALQESRLLWEKQSRWPRGGTTGRSGEQWGCTCIRRTTVRCARRAVGLHASTDDNVLVRDRRRAWSVDRVTPLLEHCCSHVLLLQFLFLLRQE
ncbi:unnamed protein product, partial [Amoebophrya sp. A25]